jgi:hypothetical protein
MANMPGPDRFPSCPVQPLPAIRTRCQFCTRPHAEAPAKVREVQGLPYWLCSNCQEHLTRIGKKPAGLPVIVA